MSLEQVCVEGGGGSRGGEGSYLERCKLDPTVLARAWRVRVSAQPQPVLNFQKF